MQLCMVPPLAHMVALVGGCQTVGGLPTVLPPNPPTLLPGQRAATHHLAACAMRV